MLLVEDTTMKARRFTMARSALGLIFVVGPLATALHLAPEPALPSNAADFMAALSRTGYMLPLLWSTEILGGVLLLSGFMVPLGLVMLAPVVVNIAAFHLFLAPAASPPALLVCTLELVLAWQYRASFVPLLGARASYASRAAGFSVNSAINE